MTDEHDCHLERTLETGVKDYFDSLADQQYAVRSIKEHKDDGRATNTPYLQGWIDALAYAMNQYDKIQSQVESVQKHHECSCAKDSSSNSGDSSE